jgi:hypothetical protein
MKSGIGVLLRLEGTRLIADAADFPAGLANDLDENLAKEGEKYHMEISFDVVVVHVPSGTMTVLLSSYLGNQQSPRYNNANYLPRLSVWDQEDQEDTTWSPLT